MVLIVTVTTKVLPFHAALSVADLMTSGVFGAGGLVLVLGFGEGLGVGFGVALGGSEGGVADGVGMSVTSTIGLAVADGTD